MTSLGTTSKPSRRSAARSASVTGMAAAVNKSFSFCCAQRRGPKTTAPTAAQLLSTSPRAPNGTADTLYQTKQSAKDS